MHGLDHGAKLGNGPHEGMSAIDDMRRQIPHVAIGLTFRPPCGGQVGVGQEILGHFSAETGDLANPAFVQKLARILRRRRADVIEPDHIHRARGLGRRDHGAAVLQRRAQGFLAKHRLAQIKGRQSDVAVHRLRRRDHHRLDLGVRDQLTPIGCRASEPKVAPITFRTFWRRGANHLQPRPKVRSEYRAHAGKRHRMGFAHVSASNNSNADF